MNDELLDEWRQAIEWDEKRFADMSIVKMIGGRAASAPSTVLCRWLVEFLKHTQASLERDRLMAESSDDNGKVTLMRLRKMIDVFTRDEPDAMTRMVRRTKIMSDVVADMRSGLGLTEIVHKRNLVMDGQPSLAPRLDGG